MMGYIQRERRGRDSDSLFWALLWCGSNKPSLLRGALFHFSLLPNKDSFHALITVCGGKTGAARTQKEVFFPMRT